MLLIPEQEIQKRFRQLSEKLKTALSSPTSFKIIDNICQTNYLKKEWVEDVAMVTAEVLLGFLHPEDMRKELQEVIGVNFKIADSISQDINKRIFAPLKEEIDKVYSPLPPLEEGEEIPLVPEKPKEEVKISPPPIDLRQKEEVKPNIPTAPTPPTITPKPLSQPPIPSSIPTSSSTTMPSGPAILFKPETASLKTPSQKSSLGGLFGLFSEKERKKEKEKVKAQIEAPTIKPTQEQKSAKTEAPTFKVVHYSQFEPKTAPTQEQSKEEPKIIFGKSEASLSSITAPKKDSLTTLSVMPETTQKSSTIPQPPSPPMPPSHLSKMEELPQPSTLPPQLPQQVDEKPKI